MLPAARLQDLTYGTCYSHRSPITTTGYVLTSQATVLVNGLPAARMMDMVIAGCGHVSTVISGSGSVFVSGLPMARMGDSVVGPYIGTIIAGSGNVFCK